jgi:outer membrane protein W
MRAKALAMVGLGLLVLSTVALPASAGDMAWKVRFGLLYSNPTGDLSSSGQTTELDGSTGIHVSAEFRVTDRIGVEPGLGYAKHDIDVKESGFPTLDFGDTKWTALTVNGNFHLLRERKFDLYVGPTIGYVFWDSINTSLFPTDVSTDDDFAIGANAGIDVPIGDSPWSFAGALRYLKADLGVQGGDDIGVDPMQVKIGLSYSF